MEKADEITPMSSAEHPPFEQLRENLHVSMRLSYKFTIDDF
jgi:hypothetical protein